MRAWPMMRACMTWIRCGRDLDDDAGVVDDAGVHDVEEMRVLRR